MQCTSESVNEAVEIVPVGYNKHMYYMTSV